MEDNLILNFDTVFSNPYGATIVHYDPTKDFNSSFTTSTLTNDKIPFYSCFSAEIVEVESEGQVYEHVIYSVPQTRYTNTRARINYTHLYEAFRSSMVPIRFPTNNGDVFVMKNCIMDTNYNILVCLCIDAKYVIQVAKNGINLEDLDKDKLYYYVSVSFEGNLRKKLDSQYFNEVLDRGIDIVYTKNINSKIFKKHHQLPQFNTIEEREEYLENLKFNEQYD